MARFPSVVRKTGSSIRNSRLRLTCPLTAEARGRPLRSDAAKNRERLLAAANKVFAEKGLEASVADVARTAGVGMGTLYRRFPTKDSLISALVIEVLGSTIQMAEQAAERPQGLGLEEFLLASCAYQAKHLGCLPKLWNTDHAMAHTARHLVGELLSEAQTYGRVRPELTSTDISMVMWSIRGILESTGASAPQAWRRHLDLLVAGMRPAAEELSHPPLSQRKFDQILGSS